MENGLMPLSALDVIRGWMVLEMSTSFEEQSYGLHAFGKTYDNVLEMIVAIVDVLLTAGRHPDAWSVLLAAHEDGVLNLWQVLVLLQWLWLLLVQCFCRGRLFINFVPGIIWSSSLDKAFTVFMVFHVCSAFQELGICLLVSAPGCTFSRA
ncbi:hypothetical protein AK812_SmicGene2577 [Symbiodinium microadriaticum]|uniref:Uncharacterized protein n=1 Tax=Symbiodinium microadriaticum TaxID=2951 RepID=A0A1Q9F1B4_SYMMI|nr:hypothetical protein AK812_SmicGene2577 [Symbiodinium microadriaticum]